MVTPGNVSAAKTTVREGERVGGREGGGGKKGGGGGSGWDNDVDGGKRKEGRYCGWFVCE